MSCTVYDLTDDDGRIVGGCLFSTTSGTVFGRRFHDANQATEFMEWLVVDPRMVEALDLLEEAHLKYEAVAEFGWRFIAETKGEWARENKIVERYERHRQLTAAVVSRAMVRELAKSVALPLVGAGESLER